MIHGNSGPKEEPAIEDIGKKKFPKPNENKVWKAPGYSLSLLISKPLYRYTVIYLKISIL